MVSPDSRANLARRQAEVPLSALCKKPSPALQAVARARQYIVQGHGWVVDLDLEKFFDRVNHDN